MFAKRTTLGIFVITALALLSSVAQAQTQLTLQGRLALFNTPSVTGPIGGGTSVTPVAVAGVRLAGGKLLAGVGFGLFGVSTTDCGNDGCTDRNEDSVSGWSLSPVVTYDLISNNKAGLYALGMFSLGGVGETKHTEIRPGDPPDVSVSEDSYFLWGVNAGLGIRGKLSKSLAIGTELTWGFVSADQGDQDNNQSVFVHGITGIVMFEASIGL